MKKNVFIPCSLFIGILLCASQSQSEVYDFTMEFAYSGRPPVLFKLMCNDTEVYAFNYDAHVETFVLNTPEIYLTFVLIAVMDDAEYASPPYIHEVTGITPGPSPVQGFQMSQTRVTIKMNYSG